MDADGTDGSKIVTWCIMSSFYVILCHVYHLLPMVYQHSASFYQLPQGDAKSERGGSWVGPCDLARSSYRRGRIPEAKGRCLGFRCAVMVADAPGM